MDFSRLKQKIKERGKTYANCANTIGKSTVSFTRKINGKVPFDVCEMEDLGNFLEMTNREKVEIFLR